MSNPSYCTQRFLNIFERSCSFLAGAISFSRITPHPTRVPRQCALGNGSPRQVLILRLVSRSDDRDGRKHDPLTYSHRSGLVLDGLRGEGTSSSTARSECCRSNCPSHGGGRRDAGSRYRRARTYRRTCAERRCSRGGRRKAPPRRRGPRAPRRCARTSSRSIASVTVLTRNISSGSVLVCCEAEAIECRELLTPDTSPRAGRRGPTKTTSIGFGSRDSFIGPRCATSPARSSRMMNGASPFAWCR